MKRAPSLPGLPSREGSERASLDLTTRRLDVKRAILLFLRAVRREGSERAPPVCKWGVPRASSREGNCVRVKYEEALSPVCIRRGRVSSSDLIFTEWGMARGTAQQSYVDRSACPPAVKDLSLALVLTR